MIKYIDESTKQNSMQARIIIMQNVSTDTGLEGMHRN